MYDLILCMITLSSNRKSHLSCYCFFFFFFLYLFPYNLLFTRSSLFNKCGLSGCESNTTSFNGFNVLAR